MTAALTTSAVGRTARLPLRAVTSGLKSEHLVFLGACAFVLVVCLTPFLLVVVVSFGHKVQGAGWEWALTLEQYRRFFLGIDPSSVTTLHLQRLFYTIFFAATAALIATIVAFPFTYAMTRLGRRAQTIWLVFLLASLSLSEVFVVMGWDILLSNRSGLPHWLDAIGLTPWLKENGWFPLLREWGLANPRDLKFKTSSFATILTMVYLVFPYAVILLYPSLSRLDRDLVDAARTMGAGRWTRVRTVVLPLVRIPLLGSLMLLFVYLLGAYVTPSVFADPSQYTLPISIYQSIRGIQLDTPFGAAQSVVLLVTAGTFVFLNMRLGRRSAG